MTFQRRRVRDGGGPKPPEQVVDRLKIRQTFQLASENNSEAILRESAAVDSDWSPIRVSAFDADRKIWSFGTPAAGMKASRALVAGRSYDVMIFLKRDRMVQFQCEASGPAELTVPTLMLRVQRRKEERHEVPAGYDLNVQFWLPIRPNQVARHPLLDISTRGLAFLIRPDEVEQFPKGFLIPVMELRIRSRKILVACEVQGTHKIRTSQLRKGYAEGAYKVGVQFRRITPEDRDFLELYVLEHRMQYFMD